jgi:hypothetical protein
LSHPLLVWLVAQRQLAGGPYVLRLYLLDTKTKKAPVLPAPLAKTSV